MSVCVTSGKQDSRRNLARVVIAAAACGARHLQVSFSSVMHAKQRVHHVLKTVHTRAALRSQQISQRLTLRFGPIGIDSRPLRDRLPKMAVLQAQ